MEVEEDAKAAIAALDGHSFAGSKIAVEVSIDHLSGSVQVLDVLEST